MGHARQVLVRLDASSPQFHIDDDIDDSPVASRPRIRVACGYLSDQAWVLIGERALDLHAPEAGRVPSMLSVGVAAPMIRATQHRIDRPRPRNDVVLDDYESLMSLPELDQQSAVSEVVIEAHWLGLEPVGAQNSCD